MVQVARPVANDEADDRQSSGLGITEDLEVRYVGPDGESAIDERGLGGLIRAGR